MIDCNTYISEIMSIPECSRTTILRDRILNEERFVSVKQALITTECYKNSREESRILKRAACFSAAVDQLDIRIDPEELIIGNRSENMRDGVISPEAGVGWLDKEIESLPFREQDSFNVKKEDLNAYKNIISPYWNGRGLRDYIGQELGEEFYDWEKVFKLNQKDHAQGHICPDSRTWLRLGPAGLIDEARKKLEKAEGEKRDFYKAMIIVLEASRRYIRRYAEYAEELCGSESNEEYSKSLSKIARICRSLADHPPESFHEAVQSIWFLFVLLQLESNANSFSPGRMDQYLYEYFEHDFLRGKLTLVEALSIVESMWVKFNHIVYMRNTLSARYFAGFTSGFNVAVGGLCPDNGDAVNILSYLFLRATENVKLPQPNLSARIHSRSPDEFLTECSRIIGKGLGMPQFFNDESIIPALERQGVSAEDSIDYAVVGCVELSTHGNNLGWSDAAMFNLVKVLELTMNNGICLLTETALGPETGYLYDFESYEEFESAFSSQLTFFIEKMVKGTQVVEKMHAEYLPSPFLSIVTDNCIEKGKDVTAGGAKYNFSGIQIIQVANLADCLYVIKHGIFNKGSIDPRELLKNLRNDFDGNEVLRQRLLNRYPKYGNDIDEVDILASKWIEFIDAEFSKYKNGRGGQIQLGLYTVSAHVPMGLNVAATPDGRKSMKPLADGGLSAVYGRDKNGPTALLNSVSKINSLLASNGTLLNMKFQPLFFREGPNLDKFRSFLKTFVQLKIHHIQFNVVSEKELKAAQVDPENYRNLLVRVAGYTARFTELSADLQEEIIKRTEYGLL